MLEHDALAGLDAIGSAFKDAADEDIRCVRAGVVDAGVAVVPQANLYIHGAGSADKNAEIGGEEDIGVAAGGVAGFDGAAVKSHHEAGSFASGDAGVSGELHGGGRAHAQRAAAGQYYGSDLGAGGDGPVRLDRGCTGGDQDGAAYGV